MTRNRKSKIKDNQDFGFYVTIFVGIAGMIILLGGAAFESLSLFSK